MKKAWLELFDWEFVTATNAALCHPKQALHKPSSDGHDRTRQLWEKNHRREMFLDEATDLCRQGHRLAPFCNFNGNTFAALARSLVDTLRLKADEAHIIRILLTVRPVFPDRPDFLFPSAGTLAGYITAGRWALAVCRGDA